MATKTKTKPKAKAKAKPKAKAKTTTKRAPVVLQVTDPRSDIPMPTSPTKLLEDLPVGASLLFPYGDTPSRVVRRRLSNQMHYLSRMKNMHFVSRQELPPQGSDAQPGIRVWRKS